MNGFTLIGLLIILSGLIAYLGDQIGMKVGKKRLSIFGLRPRYTSIIVTIITGILIAGLSVGLLLLSNSILRQALLNINSVIERLGRLNNRLTEMEKQLQQKDEKLSEMQVEIDNKGQELTSLKSQLEAKRKEYNQAEANLKEARSQLQQARKQLEKANQNIASLQKNEEKLQQRIAELQQKEEELNQKIERLNKDYEKVKELAQYYGNWAEYYKQGYETFRGSDFVYQKGDIIYSEVIVAGRSESKIITDINNFLENANKMVKEKPVKVAANGSAIRLKQEAILDMAKLLYNMEEGKRVIVRLVSRVNVPREGWVEADFTTNIDRIVFHKGELIASRKIDAGISPSNIEQELRQLLNEINQKALVNGLLPDAQGQVGRMDYSQFYELHDKIEKKEGTIVVEVVASGNIWREDNLSSSNLTFNITREEESNDSGS